MAKGRQRGEWPAAPRRALAHAPRESRPARRLVGLILAAALASAGCRGAGGDAAGTGGRSTGSGGSATGGTLGSGGTSGSGGTGGQQPAGSGGAGAGPGGVGTGGSSSGGAAGGSPIDGGLPAGTGGLAGGAGFGGNGGTSGTPPDAAVMDGGGGDAGGPGNFGGGPTPRTTAHLDIGIHDPSMIWDGRRYYLFGTGSPTTIRSSTNLSQWTNAGRVWTALPSWIATAVGQTPDQNTPWAPDITYFNGKFHLYYSASVFGRNTSAIGLATNATLDPAAADYRWVDQGLVVQTRATDNYNAIDPNIAFDAAGTPWMSFGSFWSGIKLRKLDPATGKLATDDVTVYAIASRNGGAIEAPSIISRGGFYYLFVSFDVCCQGASSTYKTMVGRSPSITGPYVDSAGRAMLQSGGDQLLATTGRYIGPGGGSAWKNGDVYLYAYHYYDGQGNGSSKLAVRPINFTADGWVTLADPLFP